MMTYVGTWMNGKRNGKGKLFDSNGHMAIEGDWLDGLLTNKGKSFYINGDVEYDGSWVDGQRNGNGKYFYGDRRFYDGNWKNNKRHGDGVSNDCLQYLNENDRKNSHIYYFHGAWVNDCLQFKWHRKENTYEDLIPLPTYD